MCIAWASRAVGAAQESLDTYNRALVCLAGRREGLSGQIDWPVLSDQERRAGGDPLKIGAAETF